jgi:hypothetical protein
MALARFMTGSQFGSVMSVTSTSPFFTRDISEALRTLRTLPAPMRWPMARPVASTFEVPRSWKRSSVPMSARARTVSGRACST